MTKLTTLAIAVVSTLTLFGCPNKKGAEKKDEPAATKPVEAAKPTEAPKPDEAKPADDKKPDETAKPAEAKPADDKK